MDANTEKLLKVRSLYIEAADNLLIRRFFDTSSLNMLDEKIQVLTDLANGKKPIDIPNFYKVLEKYPTDPNGLWD